MWVIMHMVNEQLWLHDFWDNALILEKIKVSTYRGDPKNLLFFVI